LCFPQTISLEIIAHCGLLFKESLNVSQIINSLLDKFAAELTCMKSLQGSKINANLPVSFREECIKFIVRFCGELHKSVKKLAGELSSLR
jgi:hypothetical protein